MLNQSTIYCGEVTVCCAACVGVIHVKMLKPSEADSGYSPIVAHRKYSTVPVSLLFHMLNVFVAV